MTCVVRYTVGIVAGLIFMVGICACGEGGNREWIVAWNTSWTGPESDKPVSKDGRYAYFITEKFINPTLGRWDKSWRSQPFRGRIDLISGKVDTPAWPTGYHLFGTLFIRDTLSQRLVSDYFQGGAGVNNAMRIAGYGDGRYIILIRNTSRDSGQLVTMLLDNLNDTYQIIGTSFCEGWLSTDESSVVLVKIDSGDSWIYDIATRRLKILTSDTPPLYYRGLQDLPAEKQRVASEAMGRHCAQRRFNYFYPGEEELR